MQQEHTPREVNPMVERGEAALDGRLEEIEEAKKRKEIEGNTNRYITNAWLDVTG